MRRVKLNIDRSHGANLLKLGAFSILLVGGISAPAMAQQPGQKTFPSAEEASNALVTAVQSSDERAMLGLLGPEGK